jgi:hypothetical protein
MFQLVIYDYNEKIKKISLTRLIKEQANLPLSEAKQVLDMFLDGHRLVFSFKSKSALMKFKREADSLGTKSKLESSVLKVYSTQDIKASDSHSKYSELVILN